MQIDNAEMLLLLFNRLQFMHVNIYDLILL